MIIGEDLWFTAKIKSIWRRRYILMKGKIKILGHIGLTLFLLSALMVTLVPATPVAAATAVTNVWVQFTTSTYNKTNTASDFTIHFTPATAMKRGVDTITVWFPDGSTDMGPAAFSLATALTTKTFYDVDPDGEVVTNGATDCTSAAVLSQSGYRITVTTPVNLVAGTACSLEIEAAALVKCANDTSLLPYKVKVYTSKDTTPVLSDAFYIDATGPTACVLALSPDTAGSAGQYTFTMTLPTALTAGTDTITIIFPYGTTMPSSISADQVSCQNDTGNWETCTVTPTVNQKARMVTVTVSTNLSNTTNQRVRISTAANIKNPTTVKGSPYYTDCYVFTSKDELQFPEDSGYDVTAGTATKLGFNDDAYPASSYSDSATMINMYSSQLYVEVQDAYGNVKDPDTEPTVSFTSSQGSGIFYTNASADGSGVFTQISSSATAAGLLTVYYRDSVAGTVTLTASASSYTSGTWTMTIAPGVALYDSSNNLINTYAATSTSPVAETGDSSPETQKYSADYINSAITAAVAGDTVKLGNGVYEADSDSYINLNQKITLTSVNGASYTTLKPTAAHVHALQVTVSGTAANPVIISGLTFDRLRPNVEFDAGVMNSGYDYETVQNCTFNYIIPDHAGSAEAVVWFLVGTITSATVSNNTFSNCVGFNALSSGDNRSGCIQFYDAGGGGLSGVTVSGNTLTDCNDYGITMGGFSTYPQCHHHQ